MGLCGTCLKLARDLFIDLFKSHLRVAQHNERPLFYSRDLVARLAPIPALTEWVRRSDAGHNPSYGLNHDNILKYGDVTVPIERTVWADSGGAEQENGNHEVKAFERFEAPLSFFMEWMKQKLAEPKTFSPNQSLYIAQCAISNLPTGLQAHVPASPHYIHESEEEGQHFGMGKDNVDSSSIWMGLPPTETPLHRDPNHNLFMQIAGWKRVRIIRPTYGHMLLTAVKKEIARRNVTRQALSLTMRGEEMMVGLERKMMSDFVWSGAEPEVGRHKSERSEEASTTDTPTMDESGVYSIECFQADVGPGDALYIPEGWYHSIRSIGTHTTGINISANWWYRKRRIASRPRKVTPRNIS